MFRLFAALLLTVSVISGMAIASTPKIYTGLFSNVALDGYDPVAYFTLGEPIKGHKAFESEYNGVRWHFSSEENLAAFRKNPEKYAPQYGGHCAWAASQGYVYKANPEHWTIVEGRLFLNYNADVQQKWLESPAKWIAAGDRHWEKIGVE